jgi:hypothetical protein
MFCWNKVHWLDKYCIWLIIMHGMSNIKNETPYLALTACMLQAVQVWLKSHNGDGPFTWKPEEFFCPCFALYCSDVINHHT